MDKGTIEEEEKDGGSRNYLNQVSYSKMLFHFSNHFVLFLAFGQFSI